MTEFDFFKLLFDPEEQICVSEDCRDTALSTVNTDFAAFFTINPLQGKRAAANVTAYRNILVELDNMPLLAQEEYVSKAGLEPSSIVYSGNKSMHFIFSMATEFASARHYADAVARLYDLLPAADPSCKDPARFSRTPGMIRPDTGKLQELIYLAPTRMSTADFLQRLPLVAAPAAEEPQAGSTWRSLMPLEFLEISTHPDKYIGRVCAPGRNNFFHWFGCRLRDAKLPSEKQRALVLSAYKNLQTASGFSLREALTAARIYK